MSILTKRPISHDEARDAMQRLVNSHFRRTDQECGRFGIPARPDYDDDLVLAAYIEQQRAKECENDEELPTAADVRGILKTDT